MFCHTKSKFIYQISIQIITFAHIEIIPKKKYCCFLYFACTNFYARIFFYSLKFINIPKEFSFSMKKYYSFLGLFSIFFGFLINHLEYFLLEFWCVCMYFLGSATKSEKLVFVLWIKVT